MTQHLGYLVDLATVKFDEESTQTWIHGAPLGKYDHPVYGEIEFTPERVQQFASNVKAGVRGQDLNIDYDHKTGEAAGWVKDAEARNDGLWLLVEWTKTAAQKIKEKAYRYFSPEFVDEWTHPSTKQSYKDVLFGGGITNRPFLKGILPINMSEVFAHAADQNNDGGEMDEELRKQIAKHLGLPEDAAEDKVLEALKKEPEAPKVPEPVAATEPPVTDELKKLAEDNPAIKTLMETVNLQAKQLEANTTALRERDVDDTVRKLTEKAKAKNYAIPPADQEKLKKALMDSPKELSETIFSAFESMVDAKLVSLSEVGGSRTGDKEKTGVQKFNEAVEATMKDNDKLTYSDAVVLVSAQQPQLYDEYRSESFAGRE